MTLPSPREVGSAAAVPQLRNRKRWRIGLWAVCATIIVAGLVVYFVIQEATPREVVSLESPGAIPVPTLLFSKDNGMLVVASRANNSSNAARPELYEGLLSIIDVAKQKTVSSQKLPNRVTALSLSSAGDRLAVGTGSHPLGSLKVPYATKHRGLIVYRFPELKEIAKVESDRFVNAVDISPDGTLVAGAFMSDGGGGYAEVTVYDAQTL